MPRDSANAIATEDLLKAYRLGYFPMARSREDASVVWVLPDERGVIPLDAAHVPKKLARFLKTEPFEIRINSAFTDVMMACAEATKARPDTWINDAIIEAYCELHFQGRAHSVECWRDGKLVGGLYGVVMGAAFCGESMFSRATDASKVALCHLVARLRMGGFRLLDTQFVTDHLKTFGCEEIPAREYQKRLEAALDYQARFPINPALDLVMREIETIAKGG